MNTVTLKISHTSSWWSVHPLCPFPSSPQEDTVSVTRSDTLCELKVWVRVSPPFRPKSTRPVKVLTRGVITYVRGGDGLRPPVNGFRTTSDFFDDDVVQRTYLFLFTGSEDQVRSSISWTEGQWGVLNTLKEELDCSFVRPRVRLNGI